MLKNQKEGVGDAKKYSNWAENSFTWQYIEKPSLFNNLKKYLNRKISIIEAGCGAGRTINFLIQNGASETNILGVDIDSELLKFAKKRFPKAHYIHDSISENLSLKEEDYDLITCHNVLHYLNDRQFSQTLKNFYKWLKKDGLLFIITPHPVHMAEVVYHDIGKYFKRGKHMVKTRWGEQAPYYQRLVSDYINEFVAAGFFIEQVEEPEIITEGKRDKKQYRHYSTSPARLAIKARK
jgi:SAM-dependent methyltransferase